VPSFKVRWALEENVIRRKEINNIVVLSFILCL
jgi:hypothetical protein